MLFLQSIFTKEKSSQIRTQASSCVDVNVVPSRGHIPFKTGNALSVAVLSQNLLTSFPDASCCKSYFAPLHLRVEMYNFKRQFRFSDKGDEKEFPIGMDRKSMPIFEKVSDKYDWHCSQLRTKRFFTDILHCIFNDSKFQSNLSRSFVFLISFAVETFSAKLSGAMKRPKYTHLHPNNHSPEMPLSSIKCTRFGGKIRSWKSTCKTSIISLKAVQLFCSSDWI